MDPTCLSESLHFSISTCHATPKTLSNLIAMERKTKFKRFQLLHFDKNDLDANEMAELLIVRLLS